MSWIRALGFWRACAQQSRKTIVAVASYNITMLSIYYRTVQVHVVENASTKFQQMKSFCVPVECLDKCGVYWTWKRWARKSQQIVEKTSLVPTRAIYKYMNTSTCRISLPIHFEYMLWAVCTQKSHVLQGSLKCNTLLHQALRLILILNAYYFLFLVRIPALSAMPARYVVKHISTNSDDRTCERTDIERKKPFCLWAKNKVSIDSMCSLGHVHIPDTR